MNSVKVVSFSPTGTTSKVVHGIARGMGVEKVESIDLTLPEARNEPFEIGEAECVIIGVPVYMGRVPALLQGWMDTMQGNGTPAVCVVVYGNREYENALIELKDIVTDKGFVPVAGAAYIGEHSFSESEAPTAHGRPDANDVKLAEEFGQKIRAKLDRAKEDGHLAAVDVPGSKPYGGVTELWDVAFVGVSESCVQCGHCAEVCPMGAVALDESQRIDIESCITCCACIKACPQSARSILPGPVKDAQNRLATLFSERKEPELYL